MIRLAGSFGIGYLVVPLVFFCTGGFMHMPAPDHPGAWVACQFLLLVLTPGTLALLLVADRIHMLSPIAVAIGASVGLIHWYPVFIFLAPGIFWEGGTGYTYSLNNTWVFMYLFNLVVPVYTMICATSDGTLFTLPLCILGVCVVGWWFNQKMPASTSGLTTAST